MANVVDRVVGWFDPHAGLARHFARQRLKRAFEAAAPGDKWKPRRPGASANTDHRADATMIRNKARSLMQNVSFIQAGIQGLVAATVGTGITPRATGAYAANINKVLAEWSAVCDADGRLDLQGMIAQAYRTMEVDGEVMIRLRPRLPTDGLPVPLQLQLLEIDWLDSGKSGDGTSGGSIINGIEYDALGRVSGYWLFDSHPGETALLRSLRVRSRKVDAKYIIHLYAPDRPGAGRGFSRLAPVIAPVRDLHLYIDAELARKNLETRLGVLYSGDPELMGNPAADADGAQTEANVAMGELGDLPSGGMTRLPVGSSVTVVDPKAAPGYVDYVKFHLHLISAGIGVPYEICTGDMREVNFSSARIRAIEFRRRVEQMQWLTLVPSLLRPIHRAFIDAGVLGGQFRTRNYDCDWSTPKWDYVNPQQEVQADIAEISVGLQSVSEKIRRRGYDPATVFAEIKSDFETFKSLGILDILMIKEKGRPVEQPKDVGAAPSTPAAA
jgi:lambda family phage portal protein